MPRFESDSFDVECCMDLIIKRNFDMFNTFFAKNAPAKLRLVPICRKPLMVKDISSFNKQFDLYVRNRNMTAAGHLALQRARLSGPFDGIFNRLMSVCALYGDMDALWTWWGALVAAGYKPDRVSLHFFLKACAHAKNEAQADCLLRAMISNGKSPTLLGLSSLIDCFVRVGNIQKAEAWLKMAVLMGNKLHPSIFDVLLNTYSHVGSVDKAAALLALMPRYGLVPNTATYNSVIEAYASRGDLKQVEHVYGWMVAYGVVPDDFTFGHMIRASAKCGEVKRSIFWLEQMARMGYMPTTEWYNFMVRGCVRCGHLEQVEHWLQAMGPQGMILDRTTCMLLMGAYARTDDWKKISQCVEMMALNGIDKVALKALLKPNHNKQVQLAERSMRIYYIVISALVRVGALGCIRKLLEWEPIPAHARAARKKFCAANLLAESETEVGCLLQNVIEKIDIEDRQFNAILDTTLARLSRGSETCYHNKMCQHTFDAVKGSCRLGVPESSRGNQLYL